MKFTSVSLLALGALLPGFGSAQLSGKVGPSTTAAAKAAKKSCKITDYGAKAGATGDIGAALKSAWNACKTGGEILIPEGEWGLGTWQTLSGGSGVSINLEGTIYRTGTAGGHMIIVQKSTDIEFYSSNSKGAMQGYGYEFHKQGTSIYGPRLLRFVSVTDFSVHDIALVDSPAFHFVMDTVTNGEVYNMIVRGGNRGGLDGFNLMAAKNVHVHDVAVTNKDECVTVKNKSSNVLIENVFCNWSGGCAIGSLGADTAISDIHYRNVYTSNSNQMMMIKNNGGDGVFQNAKFENFIGHGNAYSLKIDAAWAGQSKASGDGVEYKNLTFSNWKGTAANGASRGPVVALCAAAVPCENIDVSGINIWTEAGSSIVDKCNNAFGKGHCLRTGSGTYTSTATTKTVTGYSAATMPGLVTAGLGLTKSIDIPAIPTTFYPGATPLSALAGSA
ncbi:Rhamnogalacturonase A [Colletotrichum higginsianum IMI 349063]|uniref:Rhamnogalacturonase A n=1 Tax=Colletotrichum higginsianum (strain IMI 349063) TaxID=759273 RepID=A0A1B7XTT8_COLHI|nr:Rhamnogalacturonase A [Colletotrichum higginsianum IMI 349063]OBR03182.1 Rhamnogalacturonase A [Colletotrichum higginsianum IMI 349063]